MKEMWREFLKDDCLSPEKLREYFVLLTWSAGFSLQRQKYKNLSFNLSQQTGGTGSSHPLVRMSSVGVHLHVQWHGYDYTSLDIDVDLTLSVPFSDGQSFSRQTAAHSQHQQYSTRRGISRNNSNQEGYKTCFVVFVVLVTSGRSHSISHCVTVQTVSETFDMQF